MSEVPTLKLVVPAPAAPRRSRVASPGALARARRVIAVGGGKGGVGKSLVSANLGIELARRGQRVVLVDADLGGANLHTCLGIDRPRRSLSEFVDRSAERIEDLVTPTGIENLGLISGALDHLDAANPRHAQKMRLLRHIQALDVDQVVLDLGAGTHLNVLDFFLVSDHGILVIVPEPTAVENAYRFVKAAFWRRLRNIVAVYGYEELLASVTEGEEFRSPVELVEAVTGRDAEAGALVTSQLRRFRPRIVVNQARTPQDAELGDSVASVWRKLYGLEMDYLGHVDYDEELWRTVRARRPLLLEQRGTHASRFAAIADRLAALDAAPGRSGVQA